MGCFCEIQLGEIKPILPDKLLYIMVVYAIAVCILWLYIDPATNFAVAVCRWVIFGELFLPSCCVDHLKCKGLS